MVIHKYGEKLYLGIQGLIEKHLKTEAEAKIVPVLGIADASPAEGVELLKSIQKVWMHHITCMKMIKDILVHLVSGKGFILCEINEVKPFRTRLKMYFFNIIHRTPGQKLCPTNKTADHIRHGSLHIPRLHHPFLNTPYPGAPSACSPQPNHTRAQGRRHRQRSRESLHGHVT